MVDLNKYVGRSLEGLPLRERRALSGRWAAYELYTPATTPLRTVEAIGDSAAECMRALLGRSLDPRRFEYVQLA